MDGALDYAQAGQGLPLVLVHAFATDHALWEPQARALAGRCRVVAPTLRGFHGSAPTDGDAVTMDAYADDVVALMDRLGIARAVVGGISLGGYVALALAVRHPARTAGLVLANTRAGADTAEAAVLRGAMAADIAAGGAEVVVESYGDKPFGPDCPAEVKARVRALIRRQPAAGLASATRGMACRPDRSGALAALDLPALVIHGTHDQYIPSAEGIAMHRALRGSRFVEIPRAGHLSNVDSPDAFNAALGDFVASLPP